MPVGPSSPVFHNIIDLLNFTIHDEWFRSARNGLLPAYLEAQRVPVALSYGLRRPPLHRTASPSTHIGFAIGSVELQVR